MAARTETPLDDRHTFPAADRRGDFFLPAFYS